jgi:hypothetical protein
MCFPAFSLRSRASTFKAKLSGACGHHHENGDVFTFAEARQLLIVYQSNVLFLPDMNDSAILE